MGKCRVWRPEIESMTDAELLAFKQKPRTCSGPCGRALTYGHFDITSERGKKVFRTQCRECTKSYYKKRNTARRKKHRDKIVAQRPPRKRLREWMKDLYQGA